MAANLRYFLATGGGGTGFRIFRRYRKSKRPIDRNPARDDADRRAGIRSVSLPSRCFVYRERFVTCAFAFPAELENHRQLPGFPPFA